MNNAEDETTHVFLLSPWQNSFVLQEELYQKALKRTKKKQLTSHKDKKDGA